MNDHLTTFLARQRRPRTAKAYGDILRALFAFLDSTPGATWTRADIERFLWRPRLRVEKPSAASLNQELAAIRAFSSFLAERGSSALPVKDISFARADALEPAVMTAPEVPRLFREAARQRVSWRRTRDLAMLAVLTQCALRVHELVGLDVPQVDLDTVTLIAVRGKGGSVHDVPLNSEAVALLTAWVHDRPLVARPGEAALFVSRRGTRLSIRSVERLFEKLRTGLKTVKRITPHTARHTAATIAIEQGTDLAVVSQLLRHASIRTTMQYVHRADTRRRDAVRRLGALVPSDIVDSASAFLGGSKNVPANDTEGVDEQQPLDDVGAAA